MSTANLPEFLARKAAQRLDGFCRKAAEDQYRPRLLQYRIDGRRITLFELRRLRRHPDEHRELPMAQIRYTPELQQWSLHYQQGDYWQLYLNVNPTLELDKLLNAIQQDPMGYFWHD